MKPTRTKQIEQALKKPMTCKELAAAVFLSQRAAEKNMERMHKRGQVYISGWKRTGGTIARVYKLGIGTDAPRPAAFTGYERVKKGRERESPDAKDFRLARDRAAKRKIKVHPLMAAFYSIPK
jgi:predicted ArsR family transcriptional regulator